MKTCKKCGAVGRDLLDLADRCKCYAPKEPKKRGPVKKLTIELSKLCAACKSSALADLAARRSPKPNPHNEEIAARIRKGQTYRQIAADLGIGRGSVERAAEAAGLRGFRPPGVRPKVKRRRRKAKGRRRAQREAASNALN